MTPDDIEARAEAILGDVERYFAEVMVRIEARFQAVREREERVWAKLMEVHQLAERRLQEATELHRLARTGQAQRFVSPDWVREALKDE